VCPSVGNLPGASRAHIHTHTHRHTPSSGEDANWIKTFSSECYLRSLECNRPDEVYFPRSETPRSIILSFSFLFFFSIFSLFSRNFDNDGNVVSRHGRMLLITQERRDEVYTSIICQDRKSTASPYLEL